MTLSFQPIHKAHDRKSFDCGEEPLNRFLRETARRHNDQHISRTYVLVDDEQPTRIIGYYTLVVCEVDAPPDSPLYKHYPHPLPALKLARMAVDNHFKGEGHGKDMLINAILKICKAYREGVAVIGLFVDAKHHRARAFYEKYAFLALGEGNLELWLPMKDCLDIGKGIWDV